jgi:hypothetical protein
MPPIRPPTPDYELSELGPLDTGGPRHPNAMMERYRQMEQEGRLFRSGTGQPTIPLQPEYYQSRGGENLARGGAGALGFGAGTALNWDQMSGKERAFSLGMDALDYGTLGAGKLLTTPARWGYKGIRNISNLNPLNPKMISVRGGLPPQSFDLRHDAASLDEAVGRYLPSTNKLTMQPEAGVSVYQAAQFPFGRGSVFRNAPEENIWYRWPGAESDAQVRARRGGYFINPLQSQERLIARRADDMYRILGDVVPGAKGSDWESLVDENTISGVTHMPFSKFRRLPPSFFSQTGLGSATGLPVASKGMTNRALNLFSKYDMQGTPLPITPNATEEWLARTSLPSSVPWTSTFRAGAQTAQPAPNLEEEYQRTHRPKSAVRGGPRAPGEGLFNPISPSI